MHSRYPDNSLAIERRSIASEASRLPPRASPRRFPFRSAIITAYIFYHRCGRKIGPVGLSLERVGAIDHRALSFSRSHTFAAAHLCSVFSPGPGTAVDGSAGRVYVSGGENGPTADSRPRVLFQLPVILLTEGLFSRALFLCITRITLYITPFYICN